VLKRHYQILVAFMAKSKREWTTAENGLEAVEAYLASPKSYSGILMDISMPVMDGLVASRRIREFERTQDLVPTTIIALTGIASASAQQEAFASGIDLFMTKPVRLKELAEILAKNEGMRSG
jgi:CheY-like chemotaxis protein